MGNSRVGEKFHKEIELIKDLRLRNGKSKDRISTEKLTNMIVRHPHWQEIFNALCEEEESKIIKYG